MDKFLKLVKFGLDNRVAIISIWILIVSALTGGGYSLYSPEKTVTVEASEPQPQVEITPPQPPVIVRGCDCSPLVDEHEKKFHFVDN